MTDKDAADGLAVRVWDVEGHSLLDAEKWSEAVAHYEKATAAFPKHAGLAQNLKFSRHKLKEKSP
jgi:hypothetical protein